MNMRALREALRLIQSIDYSDRHIGRLTGLCPNTVGRYRRLMKAKALTWAAVQSMDDDALMACLNKRRYPLEGKRQPDWLYLHKQMQQRHQTLVQLWEEYRLADPTDAYSYAQFTYHYRAFVSKLDISMRQVHGAGEAVYVDFAGRTLPWTDSKTGERHEAQLFVGGLGASQYTFAYACCSQKQADWIDANTWMLTFFGGVPQCVVPDNLKAAVIKPGKEPELNRSYRDWAAHNGCVIEPARVRRPQDKSLAEIGVLMVTRWITVVLRRRQFFSLAEINAAIVPLLKALNERPFKRLSGCRRSRFEELDKPQLRPLPPEPYEYAQWLAAQKVPPDYHLYVHQHAYSVPYQLVGQKVEARLGHNTVAFFHKHRQVALHVRSNVVGGSTTLDSHHPRSHQAYAKQHLEQFQQWAAQIGPHTEALVKSQFEGKPSHAVSGTRACSQLQKLAGLYGCARLEAACRCASDIHSLTVSSVRSILQCHLDNQEDEAPRQVSLPLHSNVRGPDYFDQGGH